MKSLVFRSWLGRGSRRSRLKGFTLLQIVAVIAIISILAVVLFPAIGRARASARRTQCDTRLKAIALALNAYLQETNAYPPKLANLTAGSYFTDALRCPADPRADGSYEDFYVIRSPRDRSGLPILVCPFHEQHGAHGAQAYVGAQTYTKQFSTKPAVLSQANNVTLLRPGQNPVAATAGMPLYGGDRLQTSSGGRAQITFADNSNAELSGGTDITVLQSFIEGRSDAPLYSLMRQKKGEVLYTVTPGSKFDVVTPTSTAGALGTQFKIVVDNNGDTTLTVIEGKVYVSTLKRTAEALLGVVTGILPDLPGLRDLPIIGGLL